MTNFLHEFNNDQLDGLAKLSFDLAKASFIVGILPSPVISNDIIGVILRLLMGLFLGLAFSYLALLLLRVKGNIQQ